MPMCRSMAVCCLLAAAAASAGNNEWSATGPPGGYIYTIRHQGPGSSTVIAITTRSIFRSQDEGRTWTRVLEFFEPAVAQAITFNPGARDRLLLVGPLVYRSVDAGATWNFPAGPPTQVIDASGVEYSFDGTVAWVTDANGHVFRSLDDGQTWQERSTGLPALAQRILQLVTDASNRDIAYVRTGNRRLFKTLDGGGLWTELPGDVADYLDITASPTIPGLLIAARAAGAVRSADYGATWSAPSAAQIFVQVELASDLQGSALGIDPLGYVHRSTDGGLTWNAVGRLPVASVWTLSINPGNANRALIGTDGGVFLTTDGGATWSARSSGLDEAALGRVLPAQDGSGALFMPTLDEEAIYRRDPATGTWQGIARQAADTFGAPLGYFENHAIAVLPADSNTLYASRHGLLARSTDGGTTWQLLSHIELDAITFDAANPLVGYGAKLEDRLVKTVDGGVTWTPINTGLPPNGTPATYYSQILVDPANPQVLYVAGAPPVGVYRSTDAGASWSAATAGMPALIVSKLAFEPGRSTVLYAATSGGLFKSSNSGSSWTSIYQAPNGPAASHMVDVVVDPEVPRIVYATSMEEQQPLRSVDAGQTWERLPAIPGETVQRAKQLSLVPAQPGLLLATKTNAGMHEMRIVPQLGFTTDTRELFVGARQAVDLSFRNTGAYSAVRVRLTATLPPASDQYAVTTSKPGCTQTDRELDCSFDVVRPNELVNVKVTFTPANVGDSLLAATTAHGAIPGFFENTLDLRSVRRIGLRTTLASDVPSAVVGSDIVYTLTIFNDGPSPALGVQGSVLLADNVNYVSTSSAGAACAPVGRLVTCSAASVAPGAPLQASVRVRASVSGTATTTASATGEGFDLDPGDNTAAIEVTVLAAPPPTPTGGSGSGSSGGGGGISAGELMFWLAMVLAMSGTRVRMRRKNLVPAAGIEPATSSLQNWRSTN